MLTYKKVRPQISTPQIQEYMLLLCNQYTYKFFFHIKVVIVNAFEITPIGIYSSTHIL